MPNLSSQQIEYLRELDIPKERIDQIQTAIEAKGREALNDNATYKALNVEADDGAATDNGNTEPADTFTEKQRKEVAEAIEYALKAVVEPLLDRIEVLEESIEVLASGDAQKMAYLMRQTPAASIKELLSMTPIGTDEAHVDGRTRLARSAPKETKSSERGSFDTGFGFMDGILNGADELAAFNRGERDGFDWSEHLGGN